MSEIRNTVIDLGGGHPGRLYYDEDGRWVLYRPKDNWPGLFEEVTSSVDGTDDQALWRRITGEINARRGVRASRVKDLQAIHKAPKQFGWGDEGIDP